MCSSLRVYYKHVYYLLGCGQCVGGASACTLVYLGVVCVLFRFQSLHYPIRVEVVHSIWIACGFTTHSAVFNSSDGEPFDKWSDYEPHPYSNSRRGSYLQVNEMKYNRKLSRASSLSRSAVGLRCVVCSDNCVITWSIC